MNRPGTGPQSLRGLPNSFSSQQQPQPQSRSTSGRLPNGKIANNATWALPVGGMSMGSGSFQSQRPSSSAISSFAQSIGASQPAAPLDLSEFPSLSNNQPQQSSSNAWTIPASRSLGQGVVGRAPQQQTQAQQQTQQQQDDLFSSSSQLPSSQLGFRFGNQSAVGQASQGTTSEEFPPLSRNINGDIGQDRGQGILSNMGFSGQSSSSAFGGTLGGPTSIRGNGLLTALSGSIRSPTARVASPPNLGDLSISRSPVDSRQGVGIPLERDPNAFTTANHTAVLSGLNIRDQNLPPASLSQSAGKMETTINVQGNLSQQQQLTDFGIGSSQDASDDPAPDVEDPLAGMSDKDRFGLKGLLSTLKGPYTDQAALITGIDINNLGFDLNLTEKFSEQIWSPFDDGPMRPSIPKYALPECYHVHNVQPIENKLSNFSDETLMFMFYSNPQDIQQMIAAQELTNRNWRYHKKAQVWLTKDDMMVPQPISNNTEQGYYVFFDPKSWSRERRHFVLVYEDLETVPPVINQLS